MSIALAPDEVIGPAEIVLSGNFHITVETVDGTARHMLLPQEIETTSHAKGTKGVLVMRDTGFYVSYHFVRQVDIRT